MTVAPILFLSAVGSYASGSDDAIESAAKNSYTFRTYLKDDAIKVNSKDGVVTLTGTVADEYHRLLARDTVSNLPGVTGVNDKLKVAAAASPEKTLGETIDDASITAQVKLALLFHRSTSAFKTRVRTEKGVVTLTGTARTAAEKKLVTELVNDINGVEKVVNEMTLE
jgi:osmotically-inducible protein OsmY